MLLGYSDEDVEFPEDAGNGEAGIGGNYSFLVTDAAPINPRVNFRSGGAGGLAGDDGQENDQSDAPHGGPDPAAAGPGGEP